MPRKHQLAPGAVRKILEMVKTRPELTYRQISGMFGTTAGRVSQLCYDNGVRRHAKRETLPPETAAKIAEMIKTHPELPYRKIAELFGITEFKVWELARQHAIDRRKNKTPLSQDLRAKILVELKQSHNSLATDRRPIQTIAEKFNVTLSQVTNLSIKAGLFFRGKYRPFEAARDWARTSGIRSCEDWNKTPIPRDIPANPNEVYLNYGWISWPDFLGHNTWTRRTILAYLQDIQALLPSLSDADLLKLLRETGLLPVLAFKAKGNIADVLRVLRGGEPPQHKTGDEIVVDEGVADSDYEPPETEINPHAADRAKSLRAGAETIQHIIESQLAVLRSKWFRDGDAAPTLALFNQQGSEFFQEIAHRFLEEVTAVESLATPWWGLHKNGKPVPPSPMQKYVAWRLQKDRIFGNWSGTGAGKTDSAGLAAYVIGSELTVVLAANSTVFGWREQLEETFPGCQVSTKMSEVRRGKGAFLVLNYERFQTTGARAKAQKVIELRPDFVVLDEVQLVKQRGGEASNRSRVIREMLSALPNAHVLGMSATPVINELREGISLLETIRQETLPYKTKATIPNALDLFAALRQTGVRYIPKYEQTEKTVKVSTRRDDLLAALQVTDDILPIEQTLLPAKLEAIKNRIKPGTVLYLEYVEGMVKTVRVFVESLGYSVGEYVGDTPTLAREAVKKQFIAGEIDVLIGSRAISVGVDGLQQRCGQLVLLGLPWTHAAYTQLVGRVYRQGGVGTVQIVIPQVIIGSNGGRWSWDEARLKHIESKRTLAECATDGAIPTTSALSRNVMAVKAIKALNRLSKRAKACGAGDMP